MPHFSTIRKRWCRWKERGATVEKAPNFKAKVVVSDRLVTEQNPAAAAGVAEAIVALLQQQSHYQMAS